MEETARPSFSIDKSKHLPVAIVAGGAGFLGSYLCESLIKQNIIVVAIDNLSSGKKQYLKSLTSSPNFIMYEHDLNEPLPQDLRNANYIFHLAGIEEYLNGVDMTMETLLVNSIGSKNLLEACKGTDSRFLLMSSTNVYSGIMSSSNLEKYFGWNLKDEKRNAHHEAKRYAEALTTEYFKKFHINARIVRVADVYGPRMDLEAGTAMAGLTKEAIKTNQLTIFGDGLRNVFPTYVDDVIDGLNRAMFSNGTQGQIYTLANKEPVTVINLAYELQKQSDKKLQIVFKPDFEDLNLPHHSIDITKSEKDLGWKPQTSLGVGIKKTLEYFNSAQAAPLITEITVKPKNEATQKPTGTPSVKSDFKLELPRLPTLPIFNLFKKKEKKETQTKDIIKQNEKKPVKKILPETKSTKPNNAAIKNLIKITPLFIALIIFLKFFIYPLSSAVFSIWYGYENLEKSKTAILAGKTEEAEVRAAKAEASFRVSSKEIKNLIWLSSMTNTRGMAEGVGRLSLIGEDLATTERHLALAGRESNNILKGNKKSLQMEQKLTQVKLYLDTAYESISAAEAALKLVQTDSLPSYLKKKTLISQQETPLFKKTIDDARATISAMPELLALRGKKTYVLILTDSQTPTPSGGKIIAYSLFTIENGELKTVNTTRATSPDKELKGFVEPPARLKEALKERLENQSNPNPSWTFKESNWDPEFSTNAQTAEWFLNKSYGLTVDGVISINTIAARELLNTLGPVKTEPNIEISQNNITSLIKSAGNENNPPETDRLYQALIEGLTNKIANSNKNDWIKTVTVLYEQIQEKNLLLYFHDQNSALLAEKLKANNKLAGGNILYVVDTNLSSSAPFQTKRTVDVLVNIEASQSASYKTAITYQSLNNNSPEGTESYKNYSRIIIPKEAAAIQVKKDERTLNPAEYDLLGASNRQIIGVPLNITQKQIAKIEIDYTMQLPRSSSDIRFTLNIPKQPGLENGSLKVQILPYAGISIESVSSNTLVKNNTLIYNTTQQKDETFEMRARLK